MRLDTATDEQFAPFVGDRFALEPGDGRALELELAAVVPSPNPGAEGTRHPFTLRFVGPSDPILRQRIYRLDHADLGAFELFIVPIGRDAAGTTYEAVFS